MWFFFFVCVFPRLGEVWGMRLKDRFLTHGGLALWSENTSGVDACLFHSAAVPPPCPPLSLPLLHPSPPLHTVPLSLTLPFLLFSFSTLRAAGARGLGDSFHGYWLQRLDTSSQLPVVVRQPDMHSYQVRRIFFPLRPLAVRLFHYPFLLLLSFCVSRLITSPSCVFILLHSFASSLTFFLFHLFFVNYPFPTCSVPTLPGETSTTIDPRFTWITIIPPVISPSPNQLAESHWHRCSADQ